MFTCRLSSPTRCTLVGQDLLVQEMSKYALHFRSWAGLSSSKERGKPQARRRRNSHAGADAWFIESITVAALQPSLRRPVHASPTSGARFLNKSHNVNPLLGRSLGFSAEGQLRPPPTSTWHSLCSVFIVRGPRSGGHFILHRSMLTGEVHRY